MRIAVVINFVTPYTRPLFERLAESDDHELLLVTETPMERDRRWGVEEEFPCEHVALDSWTLDLARLAVGSGFKQRFDTYIYVPRRPLAPLHRFSPDVVVAVGGGVWSSPANIAALAARRRQGWAFVPWWNTFARERPTLPRRVAEPWVRYFMRSSDAWLAGGTRHARDVIRLGADPDRTVITPLTAIAPTEVVKKRGTNAPGLTRYLFVGRLIESKGLDVLLDAFDRLDTRRALDCRRRSAPSPGRIGCGTELADSIPGLRRGWRACRRVPAGRCARRAVDLRAVGTRRARRARIRASRDHD